MTKNCLYCNQPLKGRSDKKFCDKHCQNAYHAQSLNSQEVYLRKINKQLRANHSALKKACPQGKATVRKDFRKTLGMDFKHLTHTWKSKGSNIYYFCYDYGYTPSTGKDKELIIQQQSYIQ